MIARFRWTVLVFWLLVVVASAYFAIDFVSKVSLMFDPPTDSRALEDREALRKALPAQVGASDFVILLDFEDPNTGGLGEDSVVAATEPPSFPFMLNTSVGSDISLDNYTTLGVESFSLALRGAVYQQWCSTTKTTMDAGLAALQLPSCSKGETLPDGSQTGFELVTGMNGYWFTAGFSQFGADALLSIDGKSTLVQITFQGSNYNSSYPDREKEFNSFLENVLSGKPSCTAGPVPGTPVCTGGLAELFLTPVGIRARLFSLIGGTDEIVEKLAYDLLLIDGIAIPIGLLILGLALRNWRLLAPPLVMILVTVLTSFAIMRGFSDTMAVNPLVVPVMMSLSVGLNMHTALFLLNRFREGLLEDEPVLYAVQRMMRSAGYTVVVSQLSLIVCCIPFFFLKVETARAIAVSLTVTSLMVMLSSLTLCPAFLLAFPTFFEAARYRSAGMALPGRPQTKAAMAGMLIGQRTGGGAIAPADVGDDEDPHEITSGSVPGGLCGCCASVSQLLKTPWIALVAILLVLGVVTPFTVMLFDDTDYADGVEMYLPRNSDIKAASDSIFAGFGRGTLTPFKVAVLPRAGTPNMAENQSFFDAGHFVIENAVARSPDMYINESSGAFYFDGIKFGSYSFIQLASCLLSFTLPDTSQNPEYCVLKLTSSILFGDAEFAATLPNYVYDIKSMYNLMRPWVDPTSPRGRAMSGAIRSSVDDWNAKPDSETGAKVVAFGVAMSNADVVDHLERAWYWLLPMMMIMCALVILVFTGSLATMVVGVLGASCTTLVGVGFTSMVYQNGALNWLGIDSLKRFELGENTGGCVFWGVPVACVPILFGLSIGFHLFQAVSVLEIYHRTNADETTAIEVGVQNTSSALCCSFIALIASFSGHAFSQMPLLNMVAMPLVSGVLFEALITRPILAPACMHLLGASNFWPVSERNPAAFQYLSIRNTYLPEESEPRNSGPRPPSQTMKTMKTIGKAADGGDDGGESPPNPGIVP